LMALTLEQRVRSVAEPLGLGIAGLAKRAGIERATLYAAFKREKATGKHNIDHSTAEAIAGVLNRPVSWILGEDAPEQPSPAAGPAVMEAVRAWRSMMLRIRLALLDDFKTGDVERIFYREIMEGDSLGEGEVHIYRRLQRELIAMGAARAPEAKASAGGGIEPPPPEGIGQGLKKRRAGR
jgi:transcriptional regulator with XRE-family HTH domain